MVVEPHTLLVCKWRPVLLLACFDIFVTLFPLPHNRHGVQISPGCACLPISGPTRVVCHCVLEGGVRRVLLDCNESVLTQLSCTI
jgi:hypothetical protein